LTVNANGSDAGRLLLSESESHNNEKIEKLMNLSVFKAHLIPLLKITDLQSLVWVLVPLWQLAHGGSLVS
jgi:hypothetical protein